MAPSAVPEATGSASDWGLSAHLLGELTAGTSQQVGVRLTTPGGGAPTLGSFLGTSAHLTGFHVASGAAVHMHPLDSPSRTADGTDLVFHAELPEPGTYVLYLQVRVDGFLHTLPLVVTVA